ncbi:gliding motility-associated C-terminal domain-containing protein [Mucilaginibacter sp. dw_454]|uniref:T9SS type B sorting domain-containing protein n=1 Tax=Mucilaginibacter sp. dw_454 TaxID=2720079 RepID=UPI001BD2589A|nr:gliding motility-associated C-terminal domain-containing protein [Mucilaginibacter sp. dw_454]
MQKYFRTVVCITFILLWTNIVFGQAGTPSEPAPVVNVSDAIGTNIACGGDPSMSPNVQHFTIEGYHLTEDVVLRPSPNVEISTDPSTGYTRSITLNLIDGTLAKTDIYVRSAASTTAGSWTGKVVVITGAITKRVSVDGKVYGNGSLDQINDKIWVAGSTNAIHFTGTAKDFTWTNDNPAIGLKDHGVGDIALFKATNNGTTAIKAIITATPVNPSACSAGPMTFTITVNPSEPSSIITSGSLPQLNTVYGTPSTSGTFKVSGNDMTSGVTVTPPTGFEVSSDGIKFTNTIVVKAVDNISPVTVYVRISKNTPAGIFGGNVTLTSGNAAETVATATNNIVTPALVTVTADNKSKVTGTPNPVLTVTYKGFVNDENSSVLTTGPSIGTTAVLSSAVGNYPITAAGTLAENYTFNYIDGVLQVTAEPPSIVVNTAFTPNGDGINDTWIIKNIENFPKTEVQVYNRYGGSVFHSIGYPVPWNGRFNGADLAAGTYYYIVDLKNGSKPISGWLAVIK